MLKTRSGIKSQLMKAALLKGSLLAGGGVLLLTFAGAFLPLTYLKIWGFPILVTSFTFIALGMRPYKKLTRLEIFPHEIHCDATHLTFLKEGSPLFRLNLKIIEKIEFIESKEIYGIGIELKRPTGACLTLLKPHSVFATFAAETKAKVPSSDLFLPYFTNYSYQELFTILPE